MLRVVCLLILAMMIFSSALEVRTQGQKGISCCQNLTDNRPRRPVKTCRKQMSIPSHNCPEAYILTTSRGERCIKPDANWIQDELALLEQKGIECKPFFQRL